jgi:hypothetical protein
MATGRRHREEVLDGLTESDPPLAEALVGLRGSNPQAYRKAIRRIEAGRDPTELTGVAPKAKKKPRARKKTEG